MRTRIMIIIAAVAVGMLAVAGIAAYVGTIENQVAAESKTVGVVVADKDIAAGMTFDELIKNDMVSVKQIPKRFVANGAVPTTAALTGRTALVNISRGEQLIGDRFATAATSADMRIRIKDNLRAVSIPYDEVKDVAGSLAAGDLVDVVATFDKDVAGTDVTKTILANILVLSVSGSPSASDSGRDSGSGQLASAKASSADIAKKTLVLAVPAADVEKLVFAQNKGIVWLALVPAKSSNVTTAGQTATSVLAR